MRAAIAIALTACLAACIPPVSADSVELAWERSDGGGAPEYRVSQCSTVISFEGTAPDRRAAALIIRGSIRSNAGQHARALADFGRALRIDANNAQVYLERGIIHQARGAFDVAARDFDRALALQPGLQPALDHRAELLQQRVTAYRESLETLNQRLVRSPTDANLLNARCWLRTVNNDNLDAALADCNASLSALPNDANVHDSRGLVYFKRGDYAASLADYEAATQLEPERGHFLYGRGLARLGLGRTAEGNADLTRAEELEPGVTRQYQDYNIVMPKLPADAEAQSSD
jgi:tetratricopeptide (TPR) repeat protein